MNSSNETDGLQRRADQFWKFLVVLREYINDIRNMEITDDPARTKLLSNLTRELYVVLDADLTFVGYRDTEDTSGWVFVDNQSIEFPVEGDVNWHSPLIQQIKDYGWRIRSDDWEQIPPNQLVTFYNDTVERLPLSFQGKLTALIVYRLRLLKREYFLFFCYIKNGAVNAPLFTNFEKFMVHVATGVFEIGFESGVRAAFQAQRMEASTARKDALSGKSRQLVIAAAVFLLLFMATIIVLMWATNNVPANSLLLFFVVVLLVNLVGMGAVLTYTETIDSDQLIAIWRDVLKRIPSLRVFLPGPNGGEDNGTDN